MLAILEILLTLGRFHWPLGDPTDTKMGQFQKLHYILKYLEPWVSQEKTQITAELVDK